MGAGRRCYPTSAHMRAAAPAAILGSPVLSGYSRPVKWDESVCLVTGASSGIGRETARAFARRGATLIVAARREERLISLVDELGGPPHTHIVCDVSDLEQVRAMRAKVAGQTGCLDVLFNNAGIPGAGLISQTAPQEVERLIRTNLLGPIWCIQELLPLLDRTPKTDHSPVIVNLASMAGRVPVPGAAAYTSSKFGLVGFTEALWGEMRARGIHVMAVNPGFVHTEGFPMDPLLSTPLLRWAVMDASRVAEAVCRGIERGRTEVRVQGWWNPVYHATVLLGPLRRRASCAVWGRTGRRINL